VQPGRRERCRPRLSTVLRERQLARSTIGVLCVLRGRSISLGSTLFLDSRPSISSCIRCYSRRRPGLIGRLIACGGQGYEGILSGPVGEVSALLGCIARATCPTIEQVHRRLGGQNLELEASSARRVLCCDVAAKSGALSVSPHATSRLVERGRRHGRRREETIIAAWDDAAVSASSRWFSRRNGSIV
jgi:hypothetical protein